MSLSREGRIAANLREVSEIRGDLASKGIDVYIFPDDLYASKELWLSCVPTIKEWIFKVKSDDVFEALIRLLAIPPLKKTSTAKEIIGQFYRPGLSSSTKWAVGNTMSIIANDEVLDDEDLTGHAIMGLSKLKAVSTIDDIRKAENHPRAWVQKEALKTVRKSEKIIDKQNQVK